MEMSRCDFFSFLDDQNRYLAVPESHLLNLGNELEFTIIQKPHGRR